MPSLGLRQMVRLLDIQNDTLISAMRHKLCTALFQYSFDDMQGLALWWFERAPLMGLEHFNNASLSGTQSRKFMTLLTWQGMTRSVQECSADSFAPCWCIDSFACLLLQVRSLQWATSLPCFYYAETWFCAHRWARSRIHANLVSLHSGIAHRTSFYRHLSSWLARLIANTYECAWVHTQGCMWSHAHDRTCRLITCSWIFNVTYW